MKQVLKDKTPFHEQIGIGIDRLISIFNPEKAFRRAAFRQASRITAGSYKGASSNRLRSDWLPGGGSADQDLLGELPNLRQRSRDLNRNDAHAAGITQTITTNTVGSGIMLQSKIDAKRLGIDPEKAAELQAQCEREWERWCAIADAGERMHFNEIQQLVDRQELENGESVFIPVMINDPNRPYSLAIDNVESDRLDTPPSKRANKRIRSGVEVGDRGEPLAYWIKDSHPGDITYSGGFWADDYRRIPAKNEMGRNNIFHLYRVLRAGQTRGVPYFSPVLNIFKDLGDYMEAELVASRVAACFAIFIKTQNSVNSALGRMKETNAAGQRLQSIEPGMIEHLQEGQSIESFNPNRPGGTFEPFVDRILRALATGLNLPYEIVAKDFSKTNYSSARAALLQAYRYFRCRQQYLSIHLCQPIYEMVMEEAYLRGYIDVPDFYDNRYEYNRARWIASGWQWVDPLKEVMASEQAIKNNISTLADECASQGKDWEENLEQRAREAKKIKNLEEEYGVSLTEDQPAKPAPQQEEQTTGEEKEDLEIKPGKKGIRSIVKK
jgi:lambda family phage portal protein